MKDLFHQVYVISKNGPLMFARTFIEGKASADPDLSSGLITALFHFTRDTHAEMIQTMEMEDLKLVFQESETLLFSAAVDIRLPDRDAMDVVSRIRDYWILHYGEQKETTVDRSKFKAFSDEVERIIVDNLWWLGEGHKFSIRNQGRYLRETVSRPSRAVGAQYLGKSYLLIPILLALASLAISFFLGGQVVGWSNMWIEYPMVPISMPYLIAMGFNIFAAWLVMPIMTAAINGKTGTVRQVIISSGYVLIFLLGLYFVASQFYVNTIFGFIHPGFGSLSVEDRITLLNTSLAPFSFILWQVPSTVLLFGWLVLFAYVTYNIQRPKPLQHVLAIAVSFVFLALLQSAVYWVFFGTFIPTPVPLS